MLETGRLTTGLPIFDRPTFQISLSNYSFLNLVVPATRLLFKMTLMQNSKTIFVTGATGNQGGAVAHSLLKNGFRVKALTRNPDSPSAQNLKKINAEIIQGDLNNPDTFRNHLKDIDGIFSVQTFENGIDKEIRQGIALADLAKEYSVKHFLYSSTLGANLNTGIPHWESKFKIENHVRNNLPFTIIRPASLFENFLIPEVRKRIEKGNLVSPINKHVVQQFVSSKDIGEVSADIFKNSGKYAGKTISLVAEEADMLKVSAIFSEVLGKEIKYQKLPMLITRLVMGKNLYKMFKWVNKNGGVFPEDEKAFGTENPVPTELKQWIRLNFGTHN
jgi:uncharacterized protein YbjT (DUF2867 family)